MLDLFDTLQQFLRKWSRPRGRMALHSQQHELLNCPEENDETLSEMFQSGLLPRLPNPKASTDRSPSACRTMEGRPFGHHPTHDLHQSHRDQFSRYDQRTPYPSQTDPNRADLGPPCNWHYSSYRSRNSEGCYPNSLPSYLPSSDFHSYPGGGCFPLSGSRSLPGRHSPGISSLEEPGSLHSFPPVSSMHHRIMPFPGIHPNLPCCGHYGPVSLRVVHPHHLSPGPGYHVPLRGIYCPECYRHGHAGSSESGRVSSGLRQHNPGNSQLSEEQMQPVAFRVSLPPSHPPSSFSHPPPPPSETGKVFVTYEADSEDHLKEVIKFVSLLRSNGFDTHIDVFEQQLNSISKIDCMERYLNEKDYLIIIIISLKYLETVTGAGTSAECDERTSNTVYIHKQLQSEFIQNGCKNFRFIPVLFPGAKKSYVPSWLQNTHVYSWPRDRDDILRRLMRVEKYNPPPVGPLPTIVPVPI
ncbi:hypothetical protein NFI96_017050 [Prochilodus magdalenae]|nr:hypothetical protein NFI96_017050 [Prochilodus magdalenae]